MVPGLLTIGDPAYCSLLYYVDKGWTADGPNESAENINYEVEKVKTI
jgi:hypothetical protein